jgi:hypothetical protein
VTRKLIRMSLPRFLVVLLVLSAFVFSFFVSRADASSEDEAVSAISEAEEAVGLAYEAVLEAENVGAEVSGLLDKLDEAGMLLAEAQVSFRLGDFDEAYGSRVMVSWLTMAGSLVGVAVVAFGSFWGWRVFKRRYIRRLSRLKPEVAKDES